MVEFFTLPDGRVEVHEDDEIYQLEENRDMVEKIYRIIKEDYPKALDELETIYNSPNKFWRKFLIVRRFVKCNWSELDNNSDIDDEGNLKFEFCSCPLRGECKSWRIICNPELNSRILPSELRVLELIAKGLDSFEIADKLYISKFTVDTHRKKMMKKLGLHNIAQLVDYYHKHFKK